MNKPPREGVKRSISSYTPGSGSTWRDKFKQQCNDRIRSARANIHRSRRSQSDSSVIMMGNHNVSSGNHQDHQNATMDDSQLLAILYEEWQRFRTTLENEVAGDFELGLVEVQEIGNELKAQWAEEACDEYVRTEMEDVEAILDTHFPMNNEPCFVCGNGTLVAAQQGIGCTYCGLQVPSLRSVTELVQLVHSRRLNHRATCHGNCLFSWQQDVGLYMVCDACDHIETLA